MYLLFLSSDVWYLNFLTFFSEILQVLANMRDVCDLNNVKCQVNPYPSHWN